MEQVLRDKKMKRDEKAFSPPHKSIGAMLLPGMAGGKGEQLWGLLQNGSHNKEQSIQDHKEMFMVHLKVKFC